MIGLWMVVAAIQMYSAFNFSQVTAIGIIGGADGSTSIMMQNPTATNDFTFAVIGNFGLVIGMMIVLAVVVTVVLVRKKKHKG